MSGRVIAVVLLLLSAACAQIRTDSPDVVRRLQVRLAFGDHAPCDSSIRVVLTGSMGPNLAEGSVNGECVAEFSDVPSGRYHVTVRGADATNEDDGDVEVNPVISQEVEVRTRHTRDSDPSRWASQMTLVSVKQLGVPSNAAKEFEKGNRLLAKREWMKAAERLQKGLAIYPRDAMNYNNLGVAYSHLGKDAQASEALRQAITLDDHLAIAFVNLGRVSFREKDYVGAESFLTKAIRLAPPTDAGELFLLAYAQLSNHHLNEALETARGVHETSVDNHGYLHLVAANAYEQQGKIAESIAQLEFVLREEPPGAEMEPVRVALEKLKAKDAVR